MCRCSTGRTRGSPAQTGRRSACSIIRRPARTERQPLSVQALRRDDGERGSVKSYLAQRASWAVTFARGRWMLQPLSHCKGFSTRRTIEGRGGPRSGVNETRPAIPGTVNRLDRSPLRRASCGQAGASLDPRSPVRPLSYAESATYPYQHNESPLPFAALDRLRVENPKLSPRGTVAPSHIADAHNPAAHNPAASDLTRPRPHAHLPDIEVEPMPKRTDIHSIMIIAPARSSSARPASSTTPVPRPARPSAPRATASSWSTPTPPPS